MEAFWWRTSGGDGRLEPGFLQHAARKAAAPVPEAEQVVSAGLKELYMAASVAAPQSPAQQKVILRMAEKASNGKELLLVMRAAVGVFPANAETQEQRAEARCAPS